MGEPYGGCTDPGNGVNDQNQIQARLWLGIGGRSLFGTPFGVLRFDSAGGSKKERTGPPHGDAPSYNQTF